MKNQLEHISNAALKLLTPLTPEETYKIIVAEAMTLTGGAYGSVILNNDGEMNRVYSSKASDFSRRVRRRANAYKAFIQQKILVVPATKLSRSHPEIIEEKIKYTIFIPLSYQKKAIGVLVIHSRNLEEPTADDIHILSLFGAMASLAIRKTQLYTETKNALETRDHFISLASHELRTPLTSINGYIQLLYGKMKGKEGSESKWVEELYNESKRMTNLVTELLEINRIKQGELQFSLQENSVIEFFGQVVKHYENLSEREIIIDTEKHLKNDAFIGDPAKLLQVFVGLLSNAEKFSPVDTPITLSLKVSPTRFIISISDKGTGIAREDLSRIFEGFNKFGKNEEQGLGAGLLLAKHIIQFHHGKIEIKSKVKKGTTVQVTLPLIK